MSKKSAAMRIFKGLSNNAAVVIISVRRDSEESGYRTRTEFLDGPSEPSVLIACQKRVEQLEADETVVRIIVSLVVSERRRESVGPVLLPFNRVNGHSHQ